MTFLRCITISYKDEMHWKDVYLKKGSLSTISNHCSTRFMERRPQLQQSDNKFY